MPPTSKLEFAATLEDAGFAISVDGRGRCMDNIFIERLWRCPHTALFRLLAGRLAILGP